MCMVRDCIWSAQLKSDNTYGVAILLHRPYKRYAMKTSAILAISLLLICCQGKEEKKTEEGPNTVNVENVEGSLPDTSSSITIDKPTDTTKKDSLKK